MCMACNMRCCAGWENGGCGCVGGCDEPACDRPRPDSLDDGYDDRPDDLRFGTDGEDDNAEDGLLW